MIPDFWIAILAGGFAFVYLMAVIREGQRQNCAALEKLCDDLGRIANHLESIDLSTQEANTRAKKATIRERDEFMRDQLPLP